jgi:hypothetical protein
LDYKPSREGPFDFDGAVSSGKMRIDHGRGLDIPCDKSDKDLFHTWIVVVVGNGKKANF